MPDPYGLRPGGPVCPACNGARRMPATGLPCPHCRGTGLGSKRPGGAQGLGSSPNRYPGSRSAGMPVAPAGSDIVFVPQPLPGPPRMPVPAPAGPYEQETSKGENAIVQTYCNTVAVGLLSVQLLPRNKARKGLIIVNPSATLTVFVDFNNGPASANSCAILPGNNLTIDEFCPKEGIFAVASGAGPTAASVTEFS